MVLHPAPLPGRQKLEGNIAFANIAGMVGRENVVSSMGALWLPWAWLQGNPMVKGQAARGSTFHSGINRLAADVAHVPIALNDSLVVHLVHLGTQFMGLAAKGACPGSLRVGLAPDTFSRSVCLFGLQILGSIVSLVLTVLLAVIFFVLWGLSPFTLISCFAFLALSSTFDKLLGIQFFLTTLATKLVARARNGLDFGVKFSLTVRRYLALGTICTPAIQAIFRQIKSFKGFFFAAFGANSGEDKQGKLFSFLLTRMVQWLHGNVVPFVNYVTTEAIGTRNTYGLVSFAIIVPHVHMLCKRVGGA